MKKPQLSELTLREKIGQCLCVPQFDILNKTEVDRNMARPLDERDKLVEEQQYGCVWCHGGQKLEAIDMSVINWGDRMPSREYRAWVKRVDSKLKIPALRSADLELGGAGETFSDLSSICAPLNIGATDSEELAYKAGEALGKEMLCAGLNWRWGPPADIGNRFNAGGTYMRTISQEPEKIIRLTNAYVQGMQSTGVAATMKHFPGGNRNEHRDSHFTPTMLDSTMEEWWEEQGKVFQGIIDGGVWSVMTSHKAFPACDDTKIDGKPISSTISKKVMTGLLKEKMGFKGVLITDGITMAALAAFYPHEKLIVEIMKAGNDMILGCEPYDGEILEKAVLSGELPESRIDDACQRILDMKEKMGLFDDNYSVDVYEAEDIVPITKAINTEISQKSLTLVCDKNDMLPLDKNKIKNVMIIMSAHTDIEKPLEVLKSELEARGMNVKMQRRLSSFNEIKQISDTNDLIIYAGYIKTHTPKGGMVFFGDECETFHFAFSHGKEKSIGVSFGYPYIHYDYMGNCDTFINAYSLSPDIMKAFAEAIFGEIPIVGKSPVKLKPSYDRW